MLQFVLDPRGRVAGSHSADRIENGGAPGFAVFRNLGFQDSIPREILRSLRHAEPAGLVAHTQRVRWVGSLNPSLLALQILTRQTLNFLSQAKTELGLLPAE